MKKYRLILAAFFIAILVVGCKQEEDITYYQTLGVLQKTEDSTIIEADNNSRLLIENSSNLPATVKDDDRVFLYFSINDGPLPSGIDHLIDIYSIEKVPVKPVFEITSYDEDSIGNDPLNVSGLWVAKDYLNLNFVFLGGTKTHLINLVKYPGELSSDTIDLEIRHNDQDDNATNNLAGFLSFDLTSLQDEGKDSVTLCVKAREYDNRIFENCYTYKY
ncbi:MAG: NigD-like C-terminal domain-containing protein [Bacteroidales bacterium]